MKKTVNVILSIFLFLMTTITICAEDDFSDTEYWDNYCEGYRLSGSTSERYQTCTRYQRYKIEASQNRIEDLKDTVEGLKGDLEAAQLEMENINNQIAAIQTDIEYQEAEIDDLQDDIDVLEKNIAEKEEEVAVLNERVLGRMSASQSTMHFNTYLDFLLGASSFEELLRRGYGLETIMKSDEDMRNELQDVINSLNDDKAVLDDLMSDYQDRLAYLNQSKEEMSYYLDYQKQVYEETNALIEATYASIEEEYQNYTELVNAADFAGLPNSEGFISPIPGAEISAGTWYYPESFGGGIHLGVDFAVGMGTQIYAPATGVVLITSDGCGYGHLGDSCGAEGGGEVYGGNQVYLMVSAGGNIYGVIFCHLLAGTIAVEEGDIVIQGQEIAQVGSSGNSTGPHSHVELFYLGEGTTEDIPSYLERYYTKSFNCGWGSAALNRLCENGVGAPCRLRPEEYFSE